MGSGTSGVAAIIENRRFAGAEIMTEYYDVAIERMLAAADGTAKIREDKPVFIPNKSAAVARLPEEFAKAREAKE